MLYEAKCVDEGKKTVWEAFYRGRGVGSRCLSCKSVIPRKGTPNRNPSTGNVSEAALVQETARKVAAAFNEKMGASYDWSKGTAMRDHKGRYAKATTC
jgi:hypothetical protein